MTLLGTIIYVPPKDDEPGKFVPIVGESSSTLVTSLLDGTTGGNVLIFHCDEADKCLDPGFRSLNLTVSKSLRHRVSALIDGMVQAIRDDTPITAAQKELLQVSSVPLYKILTVQAAYGRGMPTDDRETLAELASVDLLFAVLDRIVSEAGRSMSSFIGADEAKIADVASPSQHSSPGARRPAGQHAFEGQSRIMQIIEKTAFIENVLATQMSPGMAAALDWSRGLPDPRAHPLISLQAKEGSQSHARDLHGWRRRLSGQCIPGGRRLDRQWRLQEPASGCNGNGAGALGDHARVQPGLARLDQLVPWRDADVHLPDGAAHRRAYHRPAQSQPCACQCQPTFRLGSR
jgi:hypothetical protein